MGLLDNLLSRFGYIKIARYGLTVAPNGHIMPISALAPPPPQPVWRAETGDQMPLPAPELTAVGQASAAPPPQPLAPAAEVAQPQSPAPSPAPEQPDPEGDWEWKLAMARAKARDDETQVIPKASQATCIVQNPLSMPRPSSPPPAPPQRMARATTPPASPTPPSPTPAHRAPARRPPGVRSKFYPSRLPGLETRPSDRPLARPSLGDDTAVDTVRAPAASVGSLPRFTERFAHAS